MKRSKKAFTIVELVIVIVVVAILAAVLIPTFASLIEKAKLSSDEQAVKSMNTTLTADEVLNGKPTALETVQTILTESGFHMPATPVTEGYRFYWIVADNRVVLVKMQDDGTTPDAIVYPKDLANKYITLPTDGAWLPLGGTGGDSPASVCAHAELEYLAIAEADNTSLYHIGICKDCQRVIEMKETHADGDNDDKCDKCGYVIGSGLNPVDPHVHIFQYTPNNDGTHKKKCVAGGVCGLEEVNESCQYDLDGVCVLCGYAAPTTTEVTGVTLQSELELVRGGTTKLLAILHPGGAPATRGDVTWSSSDTSVVTVDPDGYVTAQGAVNSTATITVATKIGSHTATCTVKIVESMATSGLQITGIDKEYPYYTVGDVLDLDTTGAAGTVTWSSSTNKVTVGSDGKIAYVEDAIPFSDAFKVTVTAADATSSDSVTFIVCNPKYHRYAPGSLDSISLEQGETTRILVLLNHNAKGTLSVQSDNTSIMTITPVAGNGETGRLFYDITAVQAGTTMVKANYLYAASELTGGELSREEGYNKAVTVTPPPATIDFSNGSSFRTSIISLAGGAANIKRIVFDYTANQFAAASLPTAAVTNTTDNITAYWDSASGTVYMLSDGEIHAPSDSSEMFYSLANVETIELINFTVEKDTNLASMFYHCTSLTRIYVKDATVDWSFGETQNSASNMFEECPNLICNDGSQFAYGVSMLGRFYAQVGSWESYGYSGVGAFSVKSAG
jgi:prepilin-type N-terminal cleavage/methylation domain-containing protein